MRSLLQSGQAALILVVFIMIFSLIMTFGTMGVTLVHVKVARNVSPSVQSYYAAEAGVEDALLRIAKGKQFTNSYSLTVGGSTTGVTISPQVGGVYTVRGDGANQSRNRSVEVTFATSSEIDGSFIYGVQVGDGGLTMSNNSKVVGNVYSNSTISGSGTITESATVAGNGNKIDGIKVNANARVYSCEDSTITGTLTYVTGGTITRCTAGSIVNGGPAEIPDMPFPITQAMIDTWKGQAEDGTIYNGNQVITSNTTLGPAKINGNLTISNNVTLTMTGTIWVTGTFTPSNNVTVKLASGYGNTSGVFIADGKITVSNNVQLKGSGSTGSYLLVVGNGTSVNQSNPAMDISNNATGAILFAPNGMMVIQNNAALLEATAYKLHLNNNAEVTYQQGLADITFSSGPSGGFEIASWREVE